MRRLDKWGVVIPQLAPASLDRASGAQVIDGSLKFDAATSEHLKRTRVPHQIVERGLGNCMGQKDLFLVLISLFFQQGVMHLISII